MTVLTQQQAISMVNQAIKGGHFTNEKDALNSLAQQYTLQGYNDTPQTALANKTTYKPDQVAPNALTIDPTAVAGGQVPGLTPGNGPSTPVNNTPNYGKYGVFTGVGTDIAGFNQEANAAMKATNDRVINAKGINKVSAIAEAPLQTAGQIANAGGQAIGEATKIAGRAADIISGGRLSKGAQDLINSPIGQQLIKTSGMSPDVKAWLANHPGAAADVQSIINLAALMSGGEAGTAANEAGQSAVKSGAKSAIKAGTKVATQAGEVIGENAPKVGQAIMDIGQTVGAATQGARTSAAQRVLSSAEKTTESILAPTKITTKAATQKILPELTARLPKATSPQGLLNTFQQRASAAGQAIGDFVDSNTLKGSVPKQKLLDTLDQAKGSFMVGGKVIEQEPIKVIDGLKEVINQFGENIDGDTMRSLRKVWDTTISKSGGYLKTTAEGTAIDLRKNLTGVLRDELAKANPDLAKLNHEYHLWQTAADVMEQTVQRKVGQSGALSKGLQMVTGAAAGSGHGILGAGAGAIAMRLVGEVANSTTWKTLSVSVKNSIAKSLAGKDWEGLAGTLGKIKDEAGKPIVNIRELTSPKVLAPSSGADKGTELLNANRESLKAQYRAQNQGLLNADNVREVFKPAGYNRINAADYHESASSLTDQLFQEDVSKLKPGDNYLFTAGSSGAGKSHALNSYPDLTKNMAAGLDGNFSSGSSLSRLKAVLDKGANVTLAYVHREPTEAWINGVIKRAVDPANGRVVPLSVMVDNFFGSQQKVLEAATKFKSALADGHLTIVGLDNRYGASGAKLIPNPIDFINKLNYDRANVTNQLNQAVHQAVQDGRITNPRTAESLLK